MLRGGRAGRGSPGRWRSDLQPPRQQHDQHDDESERHAADDRVLPGFIGHRRVTDMAWAGTCPYVPASRSVSPFRECMRTSVKPGAGSCGRTATQSLRWPQAPRVLTDRPRRSLRNRLRSSEQRAGRTSVRHEMPVHRTGPIASASSDCPEDRSRAAAARYCVAREGTGLYSTSIHSPPMRTTASPTGDRPLRASTRNPMSLRTVRPAPAEGSAREPARTRTAIAPATRHPFT